MKILKEYKWRSVVSRCFKDGRNSGGFPSHCPECESPLVKNNDRDFAKEWWASYTCTGCGIGIQYMPTDMGQSIPQLVSYKK